MPFYLDTVQMTKKDPHAIFKKSRDCTDCTDCSLPLLTVYMTVPFSCETAQITRGPVCRMQTVNS